MGVINVDVNVLAKEAETLVNLINDCNTSLETETYKVSDVVGSFNRTIVKVAPKIANNLQKAWSKGKMEEIALTTIPLAAAWIGASAIDKYKNDKAKEEAHKKLEAYYKELVSKQNLLIDKLYEINCDLEIALDSEKTDLVRLEEKHEKLKIQFELIEKIHKVNEFRKKVEK